MVVEEPFGGGTCHPAVPRRIHAAARGLRPSRIGVGAGRSPSCPRGRYFFRVFFAADTPATSSTSEEIVISDSPHPICSPSRWPKNAVPNEATSERSSTAMIRQRAPVTGPAHRRPNPAACPRRTTEIRADAASAPRTRAAASAPSTPCYIQTLSGFCYVSFIVDMNSRRILAGGRRCPDALARSCRRSSGRYTPDDEARFYETTSSLRSHDRPE